MKPYRGADVQMHIFLTSVLVRSDWSVSRHGSFIREDTLDITLGGPQSQFGRRKEEKVLDPTGTRTPTPLSSSP
jgi:hypothetical protein